MHTGCLGAPLLLLVTPSLILRTERRPFSPDPPIGIYEFNKSFLRKGATTYWCTWVECDLALASRCHPHHRVRPHAPPPAVGGGGRLPPPVVGGGGLSGVVVRL